MVAYTQGPADRPKKAGWIDLDGPTMLVRVTVWESGECDIETALIGSGEQRVEHRDLASPAALTDTLTEVVARFA
jgi:hypothetical protein